MPSAPSYPSGPHLQGRAGLASLETIARVGRYTSGHGTSCARGGRREACARCSRRMFLGLPALSGPGPEKTCNDVGEHESLRTGLTRSDIWKYQVIGGDPEGRMSFSSRLVEKVLAERLDATLGRRELPVAVVLEERVATSDLGGQLRYRGCEGGRTRHYVHVVDVDRRVWDNVSSSINGGEDVSSHLHRATSLKLSSKVGEVVPGKLPPVVATGRLNRANPLGVPLATCGLSGTFAYLKLAVSRLAADSVRTHKREPHRTIRDESFSVVGRVGGVVRIMYSPRPLQAGKGAAGERTLRLTHQYRCVVERRSRRRRAVLLTRRRGHTLPGGKTEAREQAGQHREGDQLRDRAPRPPQLGCPGAQWFLALSPWSVLGEHGKPRSERGRRRAETDLDRFLYRRGLEQRRDRVRT
eukprot:scaffold37747_cov58-Phaeocystis_antarctica.AAC.2